MNERLVSGLEGCSADRQKNFRTAGGGTGAGDSRKDFKFENEEVEGSRGSCGAGLMKG